MTPGRRAVRAQRVAKDFYLYSGLLPRLLDRLTGSRARCRRVVSALQTIDLEISPGECLGIMGPNGAGKSTLLRLLSGGLHPTSGRVDVAGRAVMLDLGMALDPDRTGRENLVANATALGLTRSGTDRSLRSMLEFSELGEAVDAPVRTYSSGMALRLSFSLYAHLEPDLLIIDEAFAVGDASFVLKCVGRLQELRKRGCAIALASHDAGVIGELCDRAMVLERGRVHFEGDPLLAGDAYHSILGLAPGRTPEPDPPAPQAPGAGSTEAFLSGARRRTDARARESRAGILGFRTLRNGQPTAGALRHGDECRIEWVVRVRETLPELTSGIHLHAELGTYVFGTSYVHLGRPLRRLEPGDYLLAISFRVLLSPGRYLLSLGVAEPDPDRHARGGRQHDRWRSAATLEILEFDLEPDEPVPFLGAVRLPAQVEEPVRLGSPAPPGIA